MVSLFDYAFEPDIIITESPTLAVNIVDSPTPAPPTLLPTTFSLPDELPIDGCTNWFTFI